MSKIVVYSSSNCPYCTAAKNLLSSKGMDFEEVILEPGDRQELFELTGGMSFPQIIIDDKPIGGFDDLRALHQAGQLPDS